MPLSVTKCHPVHFILNPGNVEHWLGILLTIWNTTQHRLILYTQAILDISEKRTHPIELFHVIIIIIIVIQLLLQAILDIKKTTEWRKRARSENKCNSLIERRNVQNLPMLPIPSPLSNIQRRFDVTTMPSRNDVIYTVFIHWAYYVLRRLAWKQNIFKYK